MQRILVGNLKFRVNERAIRSAFAPYGTVEKVHLPPDKRTRLARNGIALVEMEDANRAIAVLNGARLSISRAPLFLVAVDSAPPVNAVRSAAAGRSQCVGVVHRRLTNV
jgi:RNA recognition motif-containing protein